MNSQDHSNRTPLHIAVAELRVGAAAALVKGGASVSLKDSHGETPLDIATRQGSQGHLLRAQRARVILDVLKGRTLEEARALTPELQKKHLKVILDRAKSRKLSSAALLKNVQLFTATHEGNLPAVRSLIQLKANVQYTSYDGETPLHLACRNGNIGLFYTVLFLNSRGHLFALSRRC